MKEVCYKLVTYRINTETIITEIRKGEIFHLVVLVQDLRPPETWVPEYGPNRWKVISRPRGVFSAYCNIYFDRRYSLPGALRFGPAFPNGQKSESWYSGFIKTGAFSEFYPTGSEQLELLRIEITPRFAVGQVTYALNLNQLPEPACNTNVYAAGGDEMHILPSNIELVGTAITFKP